ncbi:acyl-CoA dehydrogenase family protein, partial [Pseudophaeobacter sp.]|uniref:acyl-CoA dehydrogenase family protein n=1 Tax=Pseudophaeobacter sp. TaxID=1971739 RepID=UPI0026193E40
MAHDGQDLQMKPIVLPELLALTGAAIAPLEATLEAARVAVRNQVTQEGRVSGQLIEANQTAAHGLSWLATYVYALRQMQDWADKLQSDGGFHEMEQLIHQIAFGEYLAQVQGGIQMNQGEILRLQDLGLGQDAMEALRTEAVVTLTEAGNTQAARSRLAELMQEQAGATMFGASGLEEELEMIRDQFRRYASDKVEPHAHDWHLKDELIPMEVIEELAEMGVFGLTIPEEFGGFGLSKA